MSQTATTTASAATSAAGASTSRIMLTPRKAPAASASAPSKQALWTWTFAAAAVAPCFARDVRSMRADSTSDSRNVFFWLGTVPCRVVTIIGIVIETWQRENVMGFTVDDGTGIVECMVKFPANSEPPHIPAVADTLRVTGKIYIRKRKDVEERTLDVERTGYSVQYASAEARHAIQVAELHRTRYSQPFVLESETLCVTPRAARVNASQPAARPTTPTPSQYARPMPSPSQRMSKTSTQLQSERPPADLATLPSPSKGSATLTHPANLRTKQRTRNTFRIYLKHYMTADPALIIAGTVFGVPKEKEGGGGTQALRVGDDSVLTSVPSQMPDMTFSTFSQTQLSVFTTPTKRRRLSSETADLAIGPTQPSSSYGLSTSQISANKEVGFARAFLEQVPELSMLAAAVARVERHMRDKPPPSSSTAKPSTSKPNNNKASERPRTREEKEAADVNAGREVLRSTLRTLVDEGALVLHEGSVWTHHNAIPTVDDAYGDGYVPVTPALLAPHCRAMLARTRSTRMLAAEMTKLLRRTDDRWRKLLVLDVRDALEEIGALKEV